MPNIVDLGFLDGPSNQHQTTFGWGGSHHISIQVLLWCKYVFNKDLFSQRLVWWLWSSQKSFVQPVIRIPKNPDIACKFFHFRGEKKDVDVCGYCNFEPHWVDHFYIEQLVGGFNPLMKNMRKSTSQPFRTCKMIQNNLKQPTSLLSPIWCMLVPPCPGHFVFTNQ